MSTDAQDLRGLMHELGTPVAVAARAATEFRQQRFSRRHPVVTFVILPVVVLFGLWVGSLVAFGLSAKAASWAIGGRGEQFPEWLVTALPIIATCIVLVPIAASAVWFCRVAGRAALGWKWPLGACLLLALVGGTAFFDMKLPGTDGVLHGTRFFDPASSETGKGHVMFGFGVNTRPRPWQALQFSIPLAVCALFAWRQVRERRRSVLTS